MKILAIQFRYLGDAALMTPALRAIREHFSDCSLHVLVAQEVVPLVEHNPCLDKVWGFPRKRGKAGLKQAWPFIRALRNEHFDRSVDFSNTDRGAIMSFLCGARQRLAHDWPTGFYGRRFCFTQMLTPLEGQHEAVRNLRLLSAWGVAIPEQPRVEIHIRNAQEACDKNSSFGPPAILCHLASSRPKKEWPLEHWIELYERAGAAGYKLIFCSGITPREQALLEQFKRRVPEAISLPAQPNLAAFLRVLSKARLFVAGDTGPLHFAAGLGVPTIGLFGPTQPNRWGPLGPQHRLLQGSICQCEADKGVCLSSSSCLAAISPSIVLEAIAKAVGPPPVHVQ